MKNVDLIVFDLDNTLYDWYEAFIPAFYVMVDFATTILSCDREKLLTELKAVHVKYHNVEHPFSLLETPSFQFFSSRVGSDAALNAIDPAFHAFNRVRRESLHLFPDTIETLTALRDQSIQLVAFTDSSYFSAVGRVDRLGLNAFFSTIYCREKSAGSINSRFKARSNNDDHIRNMVIELPAQETKPNPDVLRDIVSRESTAMNKVAYVGDSLAKDILMAKRAGCLAVWAKFGSRVSAEMYEKLVRISHWSNQDIERERTFAREAMGVRPDVICESSLKEILQFVGRRS